MPELPEVETVRRGLEPRIRGRRIISVQYFRAGLRYPLPDLELLLGRVCAGVCRRAKYLQFEFDDLLLVWHLGMSGRFHLVEHETPIMRHEHVRMLFSADVCLSYVDPRRFGYAGLLPEKDWQQHPWFKPLGPEPLDEAFNADDLFSRCRGRSTAIKPLLMDARMVVGVGNIYACESLFRAGIHPARAAGRISRKRLGRLVAVVREVLGEAIVAGGSTISDFVGVDGKPGYFAHDFQVYGREGEACPDCAAPIRRMVQTGRSTFYCPRCQH